ncbi:MAG TPA: hypothetical protein VG144_11510 [Gaiellaceae bacterium]|nr:hypothetical protein [Gaiellaceae bacterium]
MAAWDGWDLDRSVLVFTAVAYAAIWIQLSLYHWAGGFKHLAMWGPVLSTPLVIAGAALGAVMRDGIWGWIALALLGFGVLEGLLGLYFHVQGIRSQIGGISTRNLLSGPPPMLPLAYAAMGVLGAGALVWNA